MKSANVEAEPCHTAASTSNEASNYTLTQPAVEAGYDEQQVYSQHDHQHSSNAVIVTQPHAPVATYSIVHQEKYTKWAIGALILSLGAFLCFCWFIGLIVVILASKIT